jgi:hypothetical protein
MNRKIACIVLYLNIALFIFTVYGTIQYFNPLINKSTVVLVNDAQMVDVVAVQAISILGIKIVRKYSSNPVGMRNDVQENAGVPTWGWRLQRGGLNKVNYFRNNIPGRSRAIRRQNNRLIRRISRM